MNIMQVEAITKENINNIKYDDVILIFFAESGAIGEAGRVDIITGKEHKYKWYKTNYTFVGVTEVIETLSDIVREEEKLFDILPILRELNFNHSLIRKSYWVNNEWWLLDLGFGNHLLIKNKELREKLINIFSNYPTNEQYKYWENIIKKEFKVK